MLGALVPWIDQQFHDANGLPLAGGQITAYAAGTTTYQDTFSDALLTTPNTNPIVLDSAGRPPVAIFIGSTGYDFLVADNEGKYLFSSSKESTFLLFVEVLVVESLFDVDDFILAIFTEFSISIFSAKGL